MKVPGEIEPYFKIFEAAIEQSKRDILFEPVDSEEFESAVDWFVEGLGFHMLAEFIRNAEDIRNYWRSIVESRRRDALENKSGNGGLVAVQLSGICNQSTDVGGEF